MEVVNSSPGRSTNGSGGSIHQAPSTSSKFHLPELKPVIAHNNNNNQNDVNGANESLEVGTEEALSTYDRQQQQIEIAIAAAINGGRITSPFRESDGSCGASSSFSPNSEEFLHRLVNAVRKEPCLYNPNDEHYGNKHSSAQYRASVWQRLVKELNYPEDAHSLQIQWKRLRERYVRERRRKAGNIFDPNSGGICIKNFHLMNWIDEFLPDNNNQFLSNSSNNVSMQLPTTSISQQHYFEPINNSFETICKSKKNESTTTGSPSSTTSEASIISGGGQQQIILPNLRHQLKYEINGIGGGGGGNNNNSAFYSTGKANQLMYKLREELGLRVPSVIGLVNNEQQQEQQLLNFNNNPPLPLPPHHLQINPETLRPVSAECYQQIGVLPQHSIQENNNDYFLNHHQQQQSSQQPSSSSEPINNISPYINRRKRSALDSLMLLQQQQQQQNNNNLINNTRHRICNNNNKIKEELLLQQQQLIGKSDCLQQIPSIGLALHNNNNIQQQHHLPSPHQVSSSSSSSTSSSIHSIRSSSNSSNNGNNNSTITIAASALTTTTLPQQQNNNNNIIQQPIFQEIISVENEEDGFTEMIVRHLKNLNEDEKVVTKMNIQRILMDARFGRGACVRMFNDELAMEQQQRQQQQQFQQQTKFNE